MVYFGIFFSSADIHWFPFHSSSTKNCPVQFNGPELYGWCGYTCSSSIWTNWYWNKILFSVSHRLLFVFSYMDLSSHICSEADGIWFVFCGVSKQILSLSAFYLIKNNEHSNLHNNSHWGRLSSSLHIQFIVTFGWEQNRRFRTHNACRYNWWFSPCWWGLFRNTISSMSLSIQIRIQLYSIRSPMYCSSSHSFVVTLSNL